MIFREDDPKVKQYPYMADYTDFLKPMERPLLGREKEMRQLMAAMSRPELSNVILLAEAGTGKANSVDTILPVADERGYIRLGDVKIGDQVFDENGKPVNVIGVFPQGKLPAYKVTFADGTSVICNDEHLWAARTRYDHYDDAQYSIHTLRDMMNYGIIKSAVRSGGRTMNLKSWYVPTNRAVARPDKEFPITPYALGALLGDGCLTGKKAFEFSSDDEFVVQKVSEGIGALSYIKSEYNYSWHFFSPIGCNGRSDKMYLSTKDVAEKLPDDKSMFHKKSIDRCIPMTYMLGSKEQRMALLHGLMDTDGSVRGSDGRINVTFHSNSKALAKDVQILASSLGYRTSLKKQTRTDDGHKNDEYSVYFIVADEEAASLFTLPRHIEWINEHICDDKKFHHIYDDVAIAEVKDLHREDEMLCIYVDSPAHLFQITENHIVTHNTALVQGTMQMDQGRAYLEVNLPKMISNLHNENEMADKLKSLFHEVELYRKAEDKEIVLFIDEFHQIVQLSSAAVEVLKPLLADSGTRGIRVIAATTYIEYQQHISSNLPLVERLQRINLPQPSKDVVVDILRGMAKRYGVESQFTTDAMFEAIYEYTNRYIPANAQPRKSILMLDSMIGWHRVDKKPIDMKLLADVIYETEGINIAFRVDASSIKSRLDKVVIAQQFASTSIESRLQICCADLNNKNKPMSSFLFTGSTGTGKCCHDDTEIPVCDNRKFVPIGQLKPGDMVFGTNGKPAKVKGVYPQGTKHAYKVIFKDGSEIICNDEHLWSVRNMKEHRINGDYRTVRLQNILDNGFEKNHNTKKWYVPVNEAVVYDNKNLPLHPYVVGVLLGDGCVSNYNRILEIGSDDEFVVKRFSDLIGARSYNQNSHGYNWTFTLPEPKKGIAIRDQLYYYPRDLVPENELSGVFSSYSYEKYIPEKYLYGSIDQRWELLHGLMDTDGSLYVTKNRLSCVFTTTSEKLANDVVQLVNSLGIKCHLNSSLAYTGGRIKYDIRIIGDDELKRSLFLLPRKRDVDLTHMTTKPVIFNDMKILDIIDMHCDLPMTCIEVDSDDHLFLATRRFCCVHNTEMSKQLANILFEDERALVRMDMTEYALPESLERFRLELTQAVWTRPYCIILLDEIEKACAPVTRILLQVLDDGRLLDRNNREVTFKNAYIIVTTNAGSEIYKNIAQYNADDTGSGKMLEKYESLIKDSIKGTVGGGKFPPELLGRIDCLVPFQPLSEKTMATICMMKLNKLRDDIMKKHRIRVEYEKRVIPYIVQDKMTTDSDAGGARGVVSRIEREVTTALSKYINAHPEARTGGKVVYVCVKGELVAENKNRISTDAHIEVTEQRPIA